MPSKSSNKMFLSFFNNSGTCPCPGGDSAACSAQGTYITKVELFVLKDKLLCSGHGRGPHAAEGEFVHAAGRAQEGANSSESWLLWG